MNMVLSHQPVTYLGVKFRGYVCKKLFFKIRAPWGVLIEIVAIEIPELPEEELIRAVISLKTRKPPGLDGFLAQIIR